MANISAQLLGIHNIFIQRLINLSNFYFVTKPSGSDIAQTCSLLSIISPLLLYFGVRLKSKQFLMQWVTIHNKLEYIFLQLQDTHMPHTWYTVYYFALLATLLLWYHYPWKNKSNILVLEFNKRIILLFNYDSVNVFVLEEVIKG